MQEEVRSGEVWQYRLYRIPMLEEVSGFAGSRYALRLERRVIRKGGGEVREEVAYALTSLEGRPEELLALWRGHWEVENRLHHPRDTVLGEDASRSRKGAAGLRHAKAWRLRDVLINLLRLNGRSLLRSVRHFSANVHELYKLLCGS